MLQGCLGYLCPERVKQQSYRFDDPTDIVDKSVLLLKDLKNERSLTCKVIVDEDDFVPSQLLVNRYQF